MIDRERARELLAGMDLTDEEIDEARTLAVLLAQIILQASNEHLDPEPIAGRDEGLSI